MDFLLRSSISSECTTWISMDFSSTTKWSFLLFLQWIIQRCKCTRQIEAYHCMTYPKQIIMEDTRGTFRLWGYAWDWLELWRRNDRGCIPYSHGCLHLAAVVWSAPSYWVQPWKQGKHAPRPPLQYMFWHASLDLPCSLVFFYIYSCGSYVEQVYSFYLSTSFVHYGSVWILSNLEMTAAS